jgi:DNA primase
MNPRQQHPTGRSNPIQTAKNRHSLSEVVARTGITIPATRGSLVTVRCPFPDHGHYDRTPSLRLDLSAGRWWCFACSPAASDGTPLAGDVIDWVRRTETVDWRQAIAILESGRSLSNAWSRNLQSGHRPRVPKAVQDPRIAERPDLARTTSDRVQTALDYAWMYYAAGALHTQGVRYLARRGIDATLLEAHNRRFEVGHTPLAASGLVSWMRRHGFNDDELVDAGLAHRQPTDPSTLTDYYRQRILIPIRDELDELAGFIGRNIGDRRWAKYKNPPLTIRYDKSINLYQPLPAPEQPNGQVVVVEGTLDAMAIAVAAIRAGRSDSYCPITQSGRELSPHQLRYILDLHPQIPLIAMDGDPPGRDSNRRIGGAAAAIGHCAHVVALPDGEDPATWLRQHGVSGLALFSRIIDERSSIPSETPSSEAEIDGRAAIIRLAGLLAQQRRPSETNHAVTPPFGVDHVSPTI